jgi:parallel beta-helix repeat protein
LTATPEAGDELESWGGDCSGSASTCRLELTEDRAVTATFVQDTNAAESIYVDKQLAEHCEGNYSIANRDCSGEDGDAYTTPQDAADAADPGDTVYFREGVYYNHARPEARVPVLHILNSGDPHAPITYTNYLDEEVILSGLDSGDAPYKYFTVLLGERPSTQQEISGQGVQNIVIQGLIVEGAARTGLLIAGPANQNASAQNPTENIVVRRVVARNNVGGNAAGSGIHTMGKVVNVLIELCEAYNNTGNGIGFGRIAKDWHNPEPEDDMSAAQHSVIRNNLIYNNIHSTYPGNTDGMGGSHMYNCTLENNVVFGNSDDGMDIYASIEVAIRSNIVFGHSYEGGNNAGIKFSAGGGGRHLVVNNIVLNNDSYSFEGSSPSNRLREYYPSKLYHNLAYNGSFGFSLAGNFTTASGFEAFHLRNNIALDNIGQQIFGEQAEKTDSDYNFISDAAELTDLQNDGYDLHSITGDAQLGNPSLVIDTDFDSFGTVEEKLEHIRSQIRAAYCPSGSNLVDKGTLIDGYHNTGPGNDTGEDGAVWHGSAPDIGACETKD